jgi:aflatoxin B1 aldehyde reductase
MIYDAHLRSSGGFFAGKITSAAEAAPEGGRFDTKAPMGVMYRARYLKNGFFEALPVIKAAAVRVELYSGNFATPLRSCFYILGKTQFKAH